MPATIEHDVILELLCCVRQSSRKQDQRTEAEESDGPQRPNDGLTPASRSHCLVPAPQKRDSDNHWSRKGATKLDDHLSDEFTLRGTQVGSIAGGDAATSASGRRRTSALDRFR